MSRQFWTRTAAAMGLAAVPLGLYYFIQNVSGLGGGLGLITIVVLMFAAMLSPVVYVRRNVENIEPEDEPEAPSED